MAVQMALLMTIRRCCSFTFIVIVVDKILAHTKLYKLLKICLLHFFNFSFSGKIHIANIGICSFSSYYTCKNLKKNPPKLEIDLYMLVRKGEVAQW